MMIPMRPNERWSLDFVTDQMTDGRRFRILAIVDDCTRECLALVARRRIPLHEAERTVFDATHAGLAGYLFALWGLPPVIFEGVAQHHSIGEALVEGTVDARNLSDSQMVALRVHVADLAEHLRDAEGAGLAAEAGFARLSGTALGPRVAEWRRALTDDEERHAAA